MTSDQTVNTVVDNIPRFTLEPDWAKVPPHLCLGDVSGISLDADGHVWIIHRSAMSDAGTRTPNRPAVRAADGNRTVDFAQDRSAAAAAAGKVPAPPVVEFDADGNYLRGWGGPGEGYEWPFMEHTMHVDYRGNVWLTSAKGDAPKTENQILKFTRDGEFLLQIGRHGASTGSLDKENVNGAADLVVHEPTNELFVADGYRNRRVVVFDADTGEFKRMWGAYGNVPDDDAPKGWGGYGELGQQFHTVHGIGVSKDGLVYVADRRNNRIQVFDLDGTFVAEEFYDRDSKVVGTTFAVAFSPDPEQTFMYVPDASNGLIRIIERKTLREVSSFGSFGDEPGQFHFAHSVATDARGNLYTTEVLFTQRIQKWILQE
jgi:DNA-binding beta-propeller fold protein YncE